MPLILGIAGRQGASKAALCSTDATDPPLDRFLVHAWTDAVRAAEVALDSVQPGLYMLTLDVDYEVVGSEVIRVYVDVTEGSRDPAVDDAFERVLSDTGRAGEGPPSFPEGLRAVRTRILLEVPDPAMGIPRATPEVAAAFATAVGPVIERVRRSVSRTIGDHVIDIEVEPVEDQWRVSALPSVAAIEVVHAFVAAMGDADLLVDDTRPVAGQRVSLVLRIGR